MYQFFSPVLDRNYKVYHLAYEGIDSHEAVITRFNLKDDKLENRDFVRIEVTPVNWNQLGKTFKISDWDYGEDEEETLPDWYETEKAKKAIFKVLKKIYKTQFLFDLQLKELPSPIIRFIKNTEIKVLTENQKILRMEGSSIVRWMEGSSVVEEMGGSSVVGEMRGSSVVGEMRDSSVVEVMEDSSVVGEMRGPSRVREMRDSSVVEEMKDSSVVEVMEDSSRVERMRGLSVVEAMEDSSIVEVMEDLSMVKGMEDSSVVKKKEDNASTCWF